MWEQYYDQAYAAVYNFLPTLLTVSPVTMAGLGIVAVSTVLYLLTRAGISAGDLHRPGLLGGSAGPYDPQLTNLGQRQGIAHLAAQRRTQTPLPSLT